MPNWVVFVVRLTLGVAGSALMTWIGWKLGGRTYALIAFVISTPLIGVAIARPLVELAHEGMGWLVAQPMAEWQGIYYEFGGVQVRVYEHEARLWFAAKDVVKACGIEANADTFHEGRVLEGPNLRCLSAGEVEALLTTHRCHEAGRFILWMRREVTTPWERKRSGALVPR